MQDLHPSVTAGIRWQADILGINFWISWFCKLLLLWMSLKLQSAHKLVVKSKLILTHRHHERGNPLLLSIL